jgi:DNA-directed RNA polymerase beta' subunit
MNNSTIDRVRISLLSESEVINSSSCQIMVPELYDSRGIPVEGGLADRRLGVIKYNELCGTCEKNVNTCTGHTGHTTLAKAVYHPLFMQKTVEILNYICPHCGRLRGVNGSQSESVSTPGVCGNCGLSYTILGPQGAVVSGSTFRQQNPYYICDTETGALVSAHTVYQLFKKIGLKQKTWLCQKLNMAGHPSDLVIKTLLIPSLRDSKSE